MPDDAAELVKQVRELIVPTGYLVSVHDQRSLALVRVLLPQLADLVERQSAELAALRERVKELEAGLQPFAEYAKHLDEHSHPDSMGVGYYRDPNITVGDCRRAAALLKGPTT